MSFFFLTHLKSVCSLSCVPVRWSEFFQLYKDVEWPSIRSGMLPNALKIQREKFASSSFDQGWEH